MRILICGANGFVGRHLVAGLRQAGHNVVRGVRRATQASDVTIDYLADTTPAHWLPRLRGFDAVVNAVGVLRDSVKLPMETLQSRTPCALFAACAKAGIPRVVQISALGVEGALDTIYFRTRRAAEAAVFSLPETIRWLNLRPSLIYGDDGASALFFRQLARLPLHGLPMGGQQMMQPVHIDDLVAAVRNWLADDAAVSQHINAVGAEATTLRGLLDSYRAQMGYAPAWHISVPSTWVKLAAKVGDHMPASPLCSDTLAMLLAGNTGDAEGFARLLGRTPKSFQHFISN